MENLVIAVNFQDIVDDLFETAERDEYGFCPTMDFKDALRQSIIADMRNRLTKDISAVAYEDMRQQGQKQVQEFINGELKGIIHRKLRSGEFRTVRGGFQSFDEVIEKHLDKMNIEAVITRHIDQKADAFAKELRARYDNVFAAKVVGALKEQKMLAPEVAKLLLGE